MFINKARVVCAMELDVQCKHQHFLIDEKAIARILNYAFINKDDVVLEIGAGTGNLTEKLLQKAKHVLAVEKDENLAKVLKNKFRNEKNVTVIHGDVLKIKLPSFNKCVSNIPYNISEPLIWKLIRTNFEMCVFTISKKFYEKLAAKPNTKNYCLISMIAQNFYEVTLKEILSPEAFHPKPRVKSAVIVIKPKTMQEKELTKKIIKNLLTMHDKKLKNALREALIKTSNNQLTKKTAMNIIKTKFKNNKTLEKKVRNLSWKEWEMIKTIVKELVKIGLNRYANLSS